MVKTASLARTTTLIILFASVSYSATQQNPRSDSPVGAGLNATNKNTATVRLLKAFVVDDRLSALRREPSLQSIVIRRVRLAQPVYIVSGQLNKGGTNDPKFYRVAVTRRTRGWMLASAIAVPNRPGEDKRILERIENSSDPADRITLCRILIDSFGRSGLLPRAMLLLAEEAERVAKTLSQRTRRRLEEVKPGDASLRDFYLSDAMLDRYSRLGVFFEFNESAGELLYNGKAYRDIVRRFPGAEEAGIARTRLAHASLTRSPAQ